MKDFSKYKFNVRRSPKDERDWKASAIYPKITLPIKTDNRELMFTARDQGDQGSCVAMAGSAMKEWQETKEWELNEYLSPQFIYNNREDLDEEGMYMRDLMDILRQKGDCLERLCLYGSFDKPSEVAYRNASYHIVKSYAAVEAIDELKTALYVNGPCVIAVPVYNFTERMWYKRPGEYLLGGHAILVVDYDDEKGGFWIRNSWGEDWGNEGYCFMKYDDFGFIWETWTTIDEKSYNPPVPPEPKSWIEKYWWTIALGVIAIGTVIILLLT